MNTVKAPNAAKAPNTANAVNTPRHNPLLTVDVKFHTLRKEMISVRALIESGASAPAMSLELAEKLVSRRMVSTMLCMRNWEFQLDAEALNLGVHLGEIRLCSSVLRIEPPKGNLCRAHLQTHLRTDPHSRNRRRIRLASYTSSPTSLQDIPRCAPTQSRRSTGCGSY